MGVVVVRSRLLARAAAAFDGSTPHRYTTARARVFQPQTAAPVGDRGVYIGADVYTNGAFAWSAFDMYNAGITTDPNAVVLGQLGAGKSALIKTVVLRERVFGRRALIMDVKAEYGPLAAALGVVPVRVGPGSGNRVNPLDAAGLAHEKVRESRLAALAALAESTLGRRLGPHQGNPRAERNALAAALDTVCATSGTVVGGQPTVPDVAAALVAPGRSQTAVCRAGSAAALAEESRPLAAALLDLCSGRWGSMFDGPTTPALGLDGPAVVLDLSGLHGTDGLALMMACVSERLHNLVVGRRRGNLIVVEEESWAVLSDPAHARRAQARVKLARAYGVSNVLVLHRISDLNAVADDGSATVKAVRGLLADCGTKIVYRQDPDDLPATRQALGLTAAETGLVAGLPRGRALWKVGGRTTLVDHRLSAYEHALVDTEAAFAPPGDPAGHDTPTGKAAR